MWAMYKATTRENTSRNEIREKKRGEKEKCGNQCMNLD
jgi:hypothetical protein